MADINEQKRQGLVLSAKNGLTIRSSTLAARGLDLLTQLSVNPQNGFRTKRAGQGGVEAHCPEGEQSLNFTVPSERIGEVEPARRPPAEGRSHTEWSERAIALKKTKGWQGLLEWCRKWTKSEPEDATAWNNLGNAYTHLDRHSDAIEAYGRAISIDPEYAGAWNNLGIAYRRLDRYNEAIEAYHQAITVDPAYARAWYNLGFTYTHLDRHSDALNAYSRAISIDPEYAKAWYNLGVAYSLSGDRTAALNAVRELWRLDPTRADELFNVIVPR